MRPRKRRFIDLSFQCGQMPAVCWNRSCRRRVPARPRIATACNPSTRGRRCRLPRAGRAAGVGGGGCRRSRASASSVLAVVDLGAAPLQVGVAREAVLVQRAPRRARRRRAAGWRACRPRAAVQRVARASRIDIAAPGRPGGPPAAPAVSRSGGRAEQRQHQVGPGRHAPAAQRLAEIFACGARCSCRWPCRGCRPGRRRC